MRAKGKQSDGNGAQASQGAASHKEPFNAQREMELVAARLGGSWVKIDNVELLYI